MSIHSSLRGADTLRGERSVLTRVERVLKLSKDKKLQLETGSAWGLPKVRTKFKTTTGKKKAAKEEAAGEAGEGKQEKEAGKGA
jgi:small basic protein (TIGR04137 family)